MDMRRNNWLYHATNYGQMNLINEIRKLWSEHIIWTRLFIISKIANLPDLDTTTKRLLRNPSDFAQVLEIFYGKQKAEIFRRLLEEHLTIAASILDNILKGNEKAADQYVKLWYSNADQIAAVLASINPNWSEAEWKNLMYDHLKMLSDDIAARLQGEYVKDSIIFDMIEEQALAMADVMAAGIIKQFNI